MAGTSSAGAGAGFDNVDILRKQAAALYRAFGATVTDGVAVLNQMAVKKDAASLGFCYLAAMTNRSASIDLAPETVKGYAGMSIRGRKDMKDDINFKMARLVGFIALEVVGAHELGTRMKDKHGSAVTGSNAKTRAGLINAETAAKISFEDKSRVSAVTDAGKKFARDVLDFMNQNKV